MIHDLEQLTAVAGGRERTAKSYYLRAPEPTDGRPDRAYVAVATHYVRLRPPLLVGEDGELPAGRAAGPSFRFALTNLYKDPTPLKSKAGTLLRTTHYADMPETSWWGRNGEPGQRYVVPLAAVDTKLVLLERTGRQDQRSGRPCSHLYFAEAQMQSGMGQA